MSYSAYTHTNGSSVLGKRKYQVAMGYENEAPEIQEQKLALKYATIPVFPESLFYTSDGLRQILEWFDGYNEYLLSTYSALYPQNQ
jgi:hypothetical protein